MSRPDLSQRIQHERQQRIAAHRLRTRRSVSRRDGVRVEIDGRWRINFCSNDYLGLAQQFAVVNAAQDTLQRDGVGSTASHQVCGHMQIHDRLEKDIAEWLQVPRALAFSNGYMANLAVVQSLLGNGDVCVQDRLNHASLLDAARLAGCHLRRYPHGDAEGALRQLKAEPDGAALIATDGVFSMDGDIAPLRQLSLAARLQHAWLYVDDAHGVGVVGPEGRGCVAEAKLGVKDVPLQLVTLGKALGGYGAVLAGASDAIEHLQQVARPYTYTTAMAPAQAAAAVESIKLARREHWRREKLTELISHFRHAAQQHDLPLGESDTPIQPILCGSEQRAVALAEALEWSGFLVGAIRPPSVPEGASRLRVCLSASHSVEQVQSLVDTLAAAWVLKRDKANG